MSGTYDPNPGIIWYVPRSGTGVCPLLASDIERVVPGDTLFCGEIVRLDVHYLIARDRRIIEYRWVNDEIDSESLTFREISPADFISANCPPDGKLPPDLVWIKGAAAETADPPSDPPTPPGTTTGTQRETKGTSASLTTTDRKLLRAMRDMGATDFECAASQNRITARAKTGNVDSKHNQQSFKRLKDMELVGSARRVGTWLTPKGLSLLNGEKR